MRITPEDIFAFAVALAFHLCVGALLWFGLPAIYPVDKPNVVPIKAVYLDRSRSLLSAQQEAERQRQAALEAQRQREAEARRRAEAERKRKAEEEKRRAEAAAQARREEEARKRAEAERQAAELARKKAAEEAARKAAEDAARKAAEEARRKAAAEEAKRKAEVERKRKLEAQRKLRQKQAEQSLSDALAEEEKAIQRQQAAQAQAKQDAIDSTEYQRLLFSHIQNNWIRPAGTDEDFSCQIRIQQLPGGQIVGYELLESCGNPFIDASVKNAIKKSDPLPLPKNPRVFDRNLTLTFQP